MKLNALLAILKNSHQVIIFSDGSGMLLNAGVVEFEFDSLGELFENTAPQSKNTAGADYEIDFILRGIEQSASHKQFGDIVYVRFDDPKGAGAWCVNRVDEVVFKNPRQLVEWLYPQSPHKLPPYEPKNEENDALNDALHAHGRWSRSVMRGGDFMYDD